MTGIISNGLSGLIAAQRAIQTTSNNIANASTPGYVRQRVNLAEAPTQSLGFVTFGNGVQTVGVERLYDQLLIDQFQDAGSAASRADAFNSFATRMDRILGDPNGGLNSALGAFFRQIEAVNRDPTSIATRQQALGTGTALAEQFRNANGQLADLGRELDARLRQSVTSLNQLAAQIAELNKRVSSAGTNPPPDLLDEREVLIGKVAELIDVSATRLPDGTVTLLVGAGQALVVGTNVAPLAVQADSLDSTRLQVGIQAGSTFQNLSGRISGGSIGGLLAFRTDVLEAAQRDIGRLAVGIAAQFNAQHREGMDLYGQLGGDFFALRPPIVGQDVRNTGTASLTVTLDNPAALTGRDYEMRFTGSGWALYDRATTVQIALTGTGTVANPFRAEGVSITVAGAAQVGDRFLIRPAGDAANGLAVLLTDPARIAIASPVFGEPALTNLGQAAIGAIDIVNPADPKLAAVGQIVFDTPTSYYVSTGSGADLTGPLPYTSGASISFAGWSVQISGVPTPGDRFTIRPTTANSGDNANGVKLAGLPLLGYFNGGTQSIGDLGSDLVASSGAVATRAASDLKAQQKIRDQAELDLESVAGVNLEEEAVNMLKYQQAYQASAKVIAAGDELFRTLLALLGR